MSYNAFVKTEMAKLKNSSLSGNDKFKHIANLWKGVKGGMVGEGGILRQSTPQDLINAIHKTGRMASSDMKLAVPMNAYQRAENDKKILLYNLAEKQAKYKNDNSPATIKWKKDYNAGYDKVLEDLSGNVDKIWSLNYEPEIYDPTTQSYDGAIEGFNKGLRELKQATYNEKVTELYDKALIQIGNSYKFIWNTATFMPATIDPNTGMVYPLNTAYNKALQYKRETVEPPKEESALEAFFSGVALPFHALGF